MARASINKNYPGAVIQFVDRKGNPAEIDVSTKPLVASTQTPGIVDITNIQPAGSPGKFTCDVATVALGTVQGEFIADVDTTPVGEKELRVPFEITVEAEEASGGSFDLGEGVDKDATPPA